MIDEWEVFVGTLDPREVEQERTALLEVAIKDRFGTRAHKRMLAEHAERAMKRQLFQSAEVHGRLDLAVAEARGWEARWEDRIRSRSGSWRSLARCWRGRSKQRE